MIKKDIYRLEKKLNRRLLPERREFNRALIAGDRVSARVKKQKNKKARRSSQKARRSSRGNKGVCKRDDPWCENRVYYKQEKKGVIAKKTKKMGYGLFAKRDFLKGEVVIRMVEPTTAPKYLNTYIKNTVPWTKEKNQGNFTIRRDGNKKCKNVQCQACCSITVNNSQVGGAKHGKVKGTITVKNKKRCQDLKMQYGDDDPFFSIKKGKCVVPLPDDAAIRDGDGSSVAYDNTFTDMNHIPLWYRINHSSSRPNLEVRTTGAGGTGVKFVAIRPIKKDTQLFFDYGVTPAEWN